MFYKLLKGVRIIFRDIAEIAIREIDYYRVRPVSATLFLTYRCDSRCQTCSRWQLPQKYLQEHELNYLQWQNIVDQLVTAGVDTCEIFGGNVLLRKKLLLPLLAYLHHNKIAVHLPTNQIGLDKEVAEAVVKYVDTIYVSTDGLGTQQDNIRGVSGAAQNAQQAIEQLLHAREKFADSENKLRIVCNVTVSRFNADSLEALTEYALVAGFDEIHFEYAGEFLPDEIKMSAIDGVIPDPHYVRGAYSILPDQQTAKRIKQTLKQIKKKYQGHRLGIVTLNIDSRSEQSLSTGVISHRKCYVLRKEVTVDPSGNIVPCPFVTNYPVGNMLNHQFSELWTGEHFKRFREAHSAGRLTMCKRCILGVQRNPGVTGQLQRIFLSRIKPKILIHK